jgi:glycosyltransferase involved in cell wall biosynthesis
MIYFDTTEAAGSSHRSGLMRVSSRLLAELGEAAVPVRWTEARDRAGERDWFFTAELFAEADRPGFADFLTGRRCRAAALFHDAIPLKFPQITWPQSVARHPEYLKLLARFDRVWAVSATSRAELEGYWRWLRIEAPPPVSVLPLGADFNAQPRLTSHASQPRAVPLVLCTGIVEPRKNQGFLVQVCDRLWEQGVGFELHLVGRVNPHFGEPILAQIRDAARRHPDLLHFHEAADDATLAKLHAQARCTAFPTIAEGCGLPLLESLWMGVPSVCSDLPVLRENADGGGCVAAGVNDESAWSAALRRLLTDDAWHLALCRQAITRPLPTWQAAAELLRAGLTE